MIKTPNLQGIMERSREKNSGNRALTPFITGFWGGPTLVFLHMFLRWGYHPFGPSVASSAQYLDVYMPPEAAAGHRLVHEALGNGRFKQKQDGN